MADSLVLREDRDRVAVLTLNRPDRRNALSPGLIHALDEALQLAQVDDDVGAIVLTGAGERAFCAGGDLAGGLGAATGALAAHHQRGDFAALIKRLHELGKPVVAGVNGDALGGGFGLAIACDCAVVDPGARLGTPEINVGLFPMIITAELVRNIPRKILLEMMFTGRRISAEEARSWGMINAVSVSGKALEQAEALAASMASKSPAVLRLGKDAFYQTADLPLDAALKLLQFQLELNLQAEDAMEGIGAFLQKRPPEWKGR